jgi:hypothetical protein
MRTLATAASRFITDALLSLTDRPAQEVLKPVFPEHFYELRLGLDHAQLDVKFLATTFMIAIPCRYWPLLATACCK